MISYELKLSSTKKNSTKIYKKKEIFSILITLWIFNIDYIMSWGNQLTYYPVSVPRLDVESF
ncbi:MAG TPA: hypothetical protein DF774_01375 [Rheinheimera sp.]|nr:hypothetical protein [Rheinheimera sp.]